MISPHDTQAQIVIRLFPLLAGNKNAASGVKLDLSIDPTEAMAYFQPQPHDTKTLPTSSLKACVSQSADTLPAARPGGTGSNISRLWEMRAGLEASLNTRVINKSLN